MNHSVNNSRRDACPIHWGKGMEGNGREWKGKHFQDFHHHRHLSDAPGSSNDDA